MTKNNTMFSSSFYRKNSFTAFLLATCLVCISWNGNNRSNHTHRSQRADTVPGQDKIKKDIDYHLQELQKAMNQLDEQLQGKNWEKMQKDLQESLKKIDMQKINQELEEALRKVEMEKIKKEAEEALNKVTFEKIQEDIKRSMKDAEGKANMKEMEKELKKAMAELKADLEKAKHVDYDKINKELEKAKQEIQKQKAEMQVDMNKLKEELQHSRLDMQKELSRARDEISKTKEELTNYKTMISEMEKDGLLNSEDDYNIEFKDGSIYINGKEQTKSATVKYRKYITKEKLSIKSTKGNIEIN